MAALSSSDHEFAIEEALAQIFSAWKGDGYCNLRNLSMQPCFFRKLLLRLPQFVEQQIELPKKSLTLDLGENHLGALIEEDFIEVAVLLKRFPWLRIKFGCEIIAPYLKSGLTAVGMVDAWDSVVFVERPWENPFSSKISGGVLMHRLDREKLDQCLLELKKLNASMDELPKPLQPRDKYGKIIKNMLGWMDAEADTVELGIACAVKEFLKNGRIIIAQHYEYHGWAWGIDGMVVGEYEGQVTVVFETAKHNMDSQLSKAECELFSTLRYWEHLTSLSAEDLDLEDEGVKMDYIALDVARLKTAKVMFALGGVKFQKPSTDVKIKTVSWLRVQLSSDEISFRAIIGRISDIMA